MTYEKFKPLLDACDVFQISCREEQMVQFSEYYRLLTKWNQKMNLTSIISFDEVLQKHFIDSLSLAGVLSLTGEATLIDIGTGAGFPGIPLKIMFPQLNVVLLDSLLKRIQFLRVVVDALGLQNVTLISDRAEDAARDKNLREQFDLAVSRAVANLSTLSEYCIPFVKPGGVFVSYKSGMVEEEANHAKKAIRVCGGEIRKIIDFTLPHTKIERSLIVIDKKRPTPEQYPRRAGVPKKRPMEEKGSS